MMNDERWTMDDERRERLETSHDAPAEDRVWLRRGRVLLKQTV
jgi:hypothetical protein